MIAKRIWYLAKSLTDSRLVPDRRAFRTLAVPAASMPETHIICQSHLEKRAVLTWSIEIP
jgi:hypothetical protein